MAAVVTAIRVTTTGELTSGVAARPFHEHMRVGRAVLASASSVEEAVAHPHPHAFAPPWNRYMVPSDAFFVSADGADITVEDVLAESVHSTTHIDVGLARLAVATTTTTVSLEHMDEIDCGREYIEGAPPIHEAVHDTDADYMEDDDVVEEEEDEVADDVDERLSDGDGGTDEGEERQ